MLKSRTEKIRLRNTKEKIRKREKIKNGKEENQKIRKIKKWNKKRRS